MSRENDKRWKWTEEQEQMIRELYPTLGAKKLSEKMGVDRVRLTDKALHMGVKFVDPNCINWTPELIQELHNCYLTEGPTQLSKRLGIRYYALITKARRLGIDSTRKCPPKDWKWTEERLAALRERYVDEGAEKLAKEFGITVDRIRIIASRMGLHTKAGHVARGKRTAEANTSCDIHYFDKWTPNMAYILGLLFADGCVHKTLGSISIGLVTDDEAALEFIKKEMKIKSKIRRYPGKKGWFSTENRWCIVRPQSRLSISSTYLVKKALELELKPRKTYNDYPFPNIPNEVAGHFVRGFLDGDGCICRVDSSSFCSVGFIGAPKFIAGLRDMLVRLAGMQYKKMKIRKGKTTEVVTISWEKNSDLKKFYAFAYPEGYEFCLERKRIILAKWLSKGRHDRGHYFGNGKTDASFMVQWKPWAEEDREYLRQNYTRVKKSELIKTLGRSKDSIDAQAKRLGLRT